MTRREKHMTVLDLMEDYLAGDTDCLEAGRFSLDRSELLHAVRWARGRETDAPPWWAELVYELRAGRREDREEAAS